MIFLHKIQFEKHTGVFFRTVFLRDNYYSDLTSVFDALLFLNERDRQKQADRQLLSDRLNSVSMKAL